MRSLMKYFLIIFSFAQSINSMKPKEIRTKELFSSLQKRIQELKAEERSLLDQEKNKCPMAKLKKSSSAPSLQNNMKS